MDYLHVIQNTILKNLTILCITLRIWLSVVKFIKNWVILLSELSFPKIEVSFAKNDLSYAKPKSAKFLEKLQT